MPIMPAARHFLLDPPEEVVLALLGGRRLERLDVDSLRIEQAHGAAQHAALAGRVHALEHEQQRARTAASAVGEQPLLEIGEHAARARAAPTRRRACCASKPGVAFGSHSASETRPRGARSHSVSDAVLGRLMHLVSLPLATVRGCRRPIQQPEQEQRAGRERHPRKASSRRAAPVIVQDDERNGFACKRRIKTKGGIRLRSRTATSGSSPRR